MSIEQPLCLYQGLGFKCGQTVRTSPSSLYAHDYFVGKAVKKMPDYPVYNKYVQIWGIVIKERNWIARYASIVIHFISHCLYIKPEGMAKK